jgi:hypothetical protein
VRTVLGPLLAVVVVSAVTIATRVGAIRLRWLASSPRAVADGRVWLLVSSALVADRPIVLSILAFGGFAVVAAIVCGARLLWTSAALGHVGSTLAAYAGLGLVRAIEPDAFAGTVDKLDFGVSAITAAWLGAIVVVSWRRHPDGRVRAGLVAFCLVCLLVGLAADTNLTVLDVDHLYAFVIGVGCAVFSPAVTSRSSRFAAGASGHAQRES